MSVKWNFVIIFDIAEDVYGILFQNRLKVTLLKLFLGIMFPRKDV